MKYLIIGLGNIGSEYENTRHNIGFNVVEALAKSENATFETERLSMKAVVKCKGRTLVVVKPTTYMNLSGKAVKYWMTKEDIPKENILVIVDDLALPFGVLRMKGKGSDGGHNGLIDIIANLQSQEFNRIRFGIGSDFPKGRQVDYVLGKWNRDEESKLLERIDIAVEMIKSFVFVGTEKTMTLFNNK